MEAPMAKAITHKAGEGQAFWMLGGLYEVLLSSEETNGAATVMQMTLPPGMGPPPHVHHKGVTETVYVIEGTLTYQIDGKTVDGGPGSLFRIPADTVESFEPKSRVRVLITYEPGGIEKFFAEAGEPARRREIPPAPTTPPDVARLTSIGAKYGVEIKAPRT
jgi:quercetin dioxygenase-like cupin family protein